MRSLPPNFLDVEQGSVAWFDARLGMVTSSKVADAIAKLKVKSGEAACRKALRQEIICEALTHKPSEHYVSIWMEAGKENEPLARTAYELAHNVSVRQVGFATHPRIARAGASPDGLVGGDGMVEFKCPKTSTHLGYIIDGCVPKEYIPQMMWQMACAGSERLWNDFVSHDPTLPPEMQTFIRRLPRDDKLIAEMEAGVEEFLGEVDRMMNQLKTATDLQGQLEASLLITEGDIHQ